MKRISKLVNRIDEELCDAKNYAEKYLDCMAMGNSNYAEKYKIMAQEELQHSMYLHDMAVEEIDNLRARYTPPAEMQEMWDNEHEEYLERTAWIKRVLAM